MSTTSPTPPNDLSAKIDEFLQTGQELRSLLAGVLAEENRAKLLGKQLEQVKTKATELQNALGSAKQTGTGFYKDMAPLVISIFSFLLSFVTFGLTYWWIYPNIKLSGGPNVTISYRPDGRTLGLDWRLVAANYGRRMDVVNWTKAELTSPDVTTSTTIDLPESGLTLQATGGRLNPPFALKENSATGIVIKASQALGTDTHASFFDKAYFDEHHPQRSQRLRVSFLTVDGKDIFLDLYFKLSANDLASIERGESISLNVSENK